MDLVQYQCPNCGGSLEFDPQSQQFGCEWCMSKFTEEEIKSVFADNENHPLDQADPQTQAADDEFASGNNLYECTNCGAEIVSDENTAATFCCYCHSPVMLAGRLSAEYRPNKVIPFQFTNEQAKKAFKDWAGKKWFTPSDFTSATQLEKITGLYVPFWLADCRVNATFDGEGHIIHTHRSGDYEVTDTKIFDVRRAAYMEYHGIPNDGASKIEDELMEAIEPFNYNELKDFSMSYLSGFYADKYDVDKAAVLPRIKKRLEEGTISTLRNSVTGYSSVTERSKTVNIIKTDWQYMLLPVWFMNYKYNGKVYQFVMNGQTGKMAGKLPLSKPKLFVFGVGIFAAVMLISLLIGGLL